MKYSEFNRLLDNGFIVQTLAEDGDIILIFNGKQHIGDYYDNHVNLIEIEPKRLTGNLKHEWDVALWLEQHSV